MNRRNAGQSVRLKIWVIASLLCLLSLLPPPCWSGEIVFLQRATEGSDLRKKIELASSFYGVPTKVLEIETENQFRSVLPKLESDKTIAVVMSAELFRIVPTPRIISTPKRRKGRSVPWLIAGITVDTNTNSLRHLSGDAIRGCELLVNTLSQATFEVAPIKSLGHALAGHKMLAQVERAHGLIWEERPGAQIIIRLLQESRAVPIFVRVNANGKEIFFLSDARLRNKLAGQTLRDTFLEFAPLLMFVRFAAGDRAWTAVASYANLTIDDPWLTEPYGNLSYTGLLKEMQVANFHTTIAFIPWNFRRSQAAVVALMQNNRDRFSLSIHGNNHDGVEFDPNRPRQLHERNIRQAVARMEELQSLTGLGYDKVMVFPHGVVPLEALALLKRNHFLATVNGQNVPLGASAPSGPLFLLHSVTLEYANFAGIRRLKLSGEVARDWIVIQAFLGNPLLFYTHQDFFAEGIDAFNAVARAVNAIEPDTRWQSLGDIVRHLYQLRRRDDGSYDVRALAGDICLDNVSDRKAVFYVQKDESHDPQLLSVTVDGQPFPLERLADRVLVRVPMAARKSSRVVWVYEGDVAFSAVAPASVRVALIRKLADFRDMVLSRSWPGRAFVRFYYTIPWVRAISVLTILLAGTVFWYWYKRGGWRTSRAK